MMDSVVDGVVNGVVDDVVDDDAIRCRPGGYIYNRRRLSETLS
jgi:hypothetical protein